VLVVKRSSILAALLLVTGCASPAPRPRSASPPAPLPGVVEPVEKDENPGSLIWPLDQWLVEFANRNGLELRYRERDTFGRSVVRPGPGPYASEADALATLRRVAGRHGFSVTELRPHVFQLKRIDG
jgi:hypothetical protein